MTYRQEAFLKAVPGLLASLKRRGMEGHYYETSTECVAAIMEMLPEGSTISWGGSASVSECGMMDALKAGNFNLIDRMTATNDQERREIFGKTVVADYYFCSSNAITLDGELVNIDGNGNRVACIIHGPQHVFMIVGMNKLVKSTEDAVNRIRTLACPPNAVRLNMKTPCAVTGKCADCLADDCFCNQIVVTRRSRHQGRIHVFLVAEDLGF